jgi:hypothetical protein
MVNIWKLALTYSKYVPIIATFDAGRETTFFACWGTRVAQVCHPVYHPLFWQDMHGPKVNLSPTIVLARESLSEADIKVFPQNASTRWHDY